ncbi:MAG: hypothetical protein GY792_11730 [Gammaproteobacteria bacterium]|nr:hypothetical protein [Gammaproteobacteria bacterium]
MTERTGSKQQEPAGRGIQNWGPKLFLATVVAVLAFFYWLLIFSGGVTVHHG